MKILHISFSYDFTDGGITTVVKQIIKEQEKANLSVEWLTSNYYRGYFGRKDFLKKIDQINPSIIHLHGLWRLHTRVTRNFVRKDIPYVITPHGMLDDWALRQSSIKKKISWRLWEKYAFDNCSFVQALCNSELETIKRINPRWKSDIISNGISFQKKEDLSLIDRPKCWKDKLPENAKVLLFIGRFHKKKGINELIKAWEIVIKFKCSEDWWLCFVGSGDLKNFYKKNSMINLKRVIVSGPAFDIEKEKVFKNSSAFILPSFSEGLPMAPLEAMSYGIPCLISKYCNLPEAIKIGAAIESNPKIEDLVDSLKILFKMDSEQRTKISNFAFKYIEDNHNWNKINYQIMKLYSSISKDV